MRRGSTPTHTFTISLDTAIVDKVRVLYAQNGKRILKKENDQCKIDGQKIIVQLSQEDTLGFKDGVAEVQLRVNTKDGKSIPSDVHMIPVKRLLEDEVFE